MEKFLWVAGALAGALGVALGAFGAHAFNATLTQTGRLATYQTATQYLQVHALAVLLVALALRGTPAEAGWLQAAGIAFVVGMVAFSGSLYVLALANLPIMGAVAPLGGAAFILGWALLALWGLRAL